MAESWQSIARLSKPIQPSSSSPSKAAKIHFQTQTPITSSFNIKALASATSTSKNESPQWKNMERKVQRAPKPVIKVSTSDGKWHGNWKMDYLLTLRQLQLSDLAQDGEQDAEVFVSLHVQKHAGFGFSIRGRIVTSFTAKCSSCFSPFCREIDTTFDVWVLPSSKSEESELPEIGWNDPSVIYVKPGSEADLDSLIQDAVRLTASSKDTCSESCQKSTQRWQYTDGKVSLDQRWARLLEIKDSL